MENENKILNWINPRCPDGVKIYSEIFSEFNTPEDRKRIEEKAIEHHSRCTACNIPLAREIAIKRIAPHLRKNLPAPLLADTLEALIFAEPELKLIAKSSSYIEDYPLSESQRKVLNSFSYNAIWNLREFFPEISENSENSLDTFDLIVSRLVRIIKSTIK